MTPRRSGALEGAKQGRSIAPSSAFERVKASLCESFSVRNVSRPPRGGIYAKSRMDHSSGEPGRALEQTQPQLGPGVRSAESLVVGELMSGSYRANPRIPRTVVSGPSTLSKQPRGGNNHRLRTVDDEFPTSRVRMYDLDSLGRSGLTRSR